MKNYTQNEKIIKSEKYCAELHMLAKAKKAKWNANAKAWEFKSLKAANEAYATLTSETNEEKEKVTLITNKNGELLLEINDATVFSIIKKERFLNSNTITLQNCSNYLLHKCGFNVDFISAKEDAVKARLKNEGVKYIKYVTIQNDLTVKLEEELKISYFKKDEITYNNAKSELLAEIERIISKKEYDVTYRTVVSKEDDNQIDDDMFNKAILSENKYEIKEYLQTHTVKATANKFLNNIEIDFWSHPHFSYNNYFETYSYGSDYVKKQIIESVLSYCVL